MTLKIYNYQGPVNEDYNVVNTPAPPGKFKNLNLEVVIFMLSVLRFSSYLFCLEFQTPAPALVNHNDGLDDDEDEPLNENDDDDEDELNNIDEGEELHTQHLVLAQFDKV